MSLLQPHSTQYLLELQLKEDKKKWYVFAQGISPLFYRLEGIRHFRIYKQWVEETDFHKQDITYRLLQFQQRVRQYLRMKKLWFRYWRKLETGEVTFQQLSYRAMNQK
jgi:hypothetical protein